MNSINTFSTKRVGWLLRSEFLGHRRLFTLEIVAVFVLALLIFGVDYFRDFEQIKRSHIMFFPAIYILGGIAFTSSIFHQMRQSNGRSHYLTLPAATSEKFITKWLIATVGWILGFTLIYSFFTTSLYLIANLFYEVPYQTLLDLKQGWLVFTIIYVALQSVFMVGAVYFNGINFFKTIAAIIPFIAVFAIIAGFIAYFLFPFPLGSSNGLYRIDPNFEHQIESIKDYVFVIGVGILLPLLMWTVAYFKLKEKEV